MSALKMATHEYWNDRKKAENHALEKKFTN
jgi:hypothetical protein